MFNFGRLSRSPTRHQPRHQPRDPLENERPLPFGWVRAISNNVDPDRVYYTNGIQSRWDFPNQEEDERRARIELAQRRQARRQARIQLAQAEQEHRAIIPNLRENLALISNNDFNEHNMDVLITLRMIILEDNEEPINILTIGTYMRDLNALIYFLRNRDLHYDLKSLCEQIFEEIYEKLAKEKQMLDRGITSHNEIDTEYINEELNMLNFMYISFRNVINNVSDLPGPHYLSVETRRALLLLPNIYIDPRLESWENMSRRYESFDVSIYRTFGAHSGGSTFITPNGNHASYENFLRGEDGEVEDIRFVVFTGGHLRPGQQLLPLTQDQEVQLQNVHNVLERCSRELHRYY